MSEPEEDIVLMVRELRRNRSKDPFELGEFVKNIVLGVLFGVLILLCYRAIFLCP